MLNTLILMSKTLKICDFQKIIFKKIAERFVFGEQKTGKFKKNKFRRKKGTKWVQKISTLKFA